MSSKSSRGNYYKNRTKLWYEARGYTVQLTEFTCARMIPGGRVVYKKIDIFGSDGIAMNGKEIIFWNSKSVQDGQIAREKSTGKKEFLQYPFPPLVKLHLVIWEPRKKPKVYELDEEMEHGSKEVEIDIPREGNIDV